jgi:hypothetical protein
MDDINPSQQKSVQIRHFSRCDRAQPATVQNRTRIQKRADRFSSLCDLRQVPLAFLAGTLTLACAPSPLATPSAVLVARAVVWVDASATSGGSGSREQPLKQIPVLAEGTHLHLMSGLYRGPFSFPPNSTVEGHGSVVLYAESPDVVVSVEKGPITLRSLYIQGGDTGVATTQPLVLEKVQISGHRQTALVAVDAGVTISGLEVHSRISTTQGIVITRGTLVLDGGLFEGPMRHAVALEDTDATVSQVRMRGPSTALKASVTRLRVDTLETAGGNQAAIFLKEGIAELRNLEMTGHEYAILGSGRIDVRSLRAHGPAAGGISLERARVSLDGIQITRAGPLGGVQLLECDSSLGSVEVRDSNAWGVMIRKGRARLASLKASQLRGENTSSATSLGDALHTREAIVDVTRLETADLEGSALFASAFSVVTLATVVAQRSGGGAIVVERDSRAIIHDLDVAGSVGPAVSVLDRSTLHLRRFSAPQADISLWADCAQGAYVSIRSVTPHTVIPKTPCVLSEP